MKWLIDEVLPQRQIKFIGIATGAFVVTFCCRLLQSNGSMMIFRSSQKLAFRVRLELPAICRPFQRSITAARKWETSFIVWSRT